jgi:hypothetical protein
MPADLARSYLAGSKVFLAAPDRALGDAIPATLVVIRGSEVDEVGVVAKLAVESDQTYTASST